MASAVGLTLLIPLTARGAITPPSIAVRADLASVHVSWRRATLPVGGRYLVTSSPKQYTCSTTSTSCTITVGATQPTLRFQVAVLSAKGVLVTKSNLSSPLTTVHLFVLAGQSNAAGWSSVVTRSSPKFDLWNGSTRSAVDSRATITWLGCGLQSSGATPVPLTAHQHYLPLPSVPTFGPEVGIARRLWSAGWRNLAFVKVTCGGTDLEHFWYQGSDQFSTLVSSTLAMEGWFTAHNTVPVLSGGFWVQGEADAQDLSAAVQYYDHGTALIQAVRAATISVRTFPIILGSIDISQWIQHWHTTNGSCISTECLDYERGNTEVRAADRRAAAEMPNVYVVDTAAIPRNTVDYIHLGPEGQLQLGKSLGDAFLRVAKK